VNVAAASRPVALVTGGTGDLGRAVCQRLAAAGSLVAVHYRQNETAADELVQSIVMGGGHARAHRADLSIPDGPTNLVDAVMTAHGRIDVLVNNAGIVQDSLLFSMSDEMLDGVIDLNLKSVFRVTRAAARHMMSAKHGVIINISSAAASKPGRGQSNYAAAKAGLEGFTKAMAVELASKRIRVNAVAPGIIESAMTQRVRDAAGEQILERIPLRRFGVPQDVAAAVAFLASDDAAYITGEVLHVDGGLR
jgi:3-oxoacyl-[acyl-carrier protein] reductase